MSELMKTRNGGRDFRWQLLASVSAAALAASAYAPGAALADDSTDRPAVWIELGGQLEQSSGGEEPFAPALTANLPDNFFSPISVQKPLLYSYGGEGALSFQPDGSDWIFSASIRYGRSNGVAQKHQQTPNAKVPVHFTFNGQYTKLTSKYPSSHVKFEDAKAQKSETHAVLDFQAGKDVGLGMFGNHGSSVLSAGIRFAQFSSKSIVTMHMEPDVQYPTKPITSIPGLIAWSTASMHFHDDVAMENSQHSFRGLGPSVAWNVSSPFVGNPERGEITLNWGANAAILFGRQKASGHHQTTVLSYYKKNGVYKKQGFISAFGTVSVIPHHYAPALFNRMRTVVVPNLGGFAGLSYSFTNAKLSLGYRADFFFGAMDGGIDAAKKENRGFYGPFASISIGIGG